MRKTEITTRHVAIVPTFDDAWKFVLDHIESTGPCSSVHITPMDTFLDDAPCDSSYEVVIEGMVER
jgi:hypothetical protein